MKKLNVLRLAFLLVFAEATFPRVGHAAKVVLPAGPVVSLVRTPNGGIQPQAAVDSKGNLHLVYFKGDPAAGDIFYVQRKAGETVFSVPLRVNSEPNSAIAMGTIRGAQLSIGKRDRVHVAWNGSGRAPKGVGGTPMLYSRLNDDGTSFEPERNLVTWAGGLDGGGTIAADVKGDVYVAWHASAGTANEEAGRAVFLARSTDDGVTFEKERRISPDSTGACGCCQMRAHVDATGALYVVYRMAGENVNRDSVLLVSTDKGDSFANYDVEKWKIDACPMSSFALASSAQTAYAAWETDDHLSLAALRPRSAHPEQLVRVAGSKKPCKHPTLAIDANGDLLFAWTEGTGWARGGKLVWQLYDAALNPIGEGGRADGVPAWGLPTAVNTPDGLTLIY